MKSIAIDFGGSSIKMVLFQDGKISKRRTIPAYSHKGLAPRLADTEAAVRGMLEGEELREYAGVGIAMPGIVDPVRKKVLGIYDKYEVSKSLDLEQWCREAFGLPMVMEMDSKLALMGELNSGCGQGYKDAVMLILGTGVGTAVAFDGKILNSRNYVAGALSSHIIINMDGDQCTCPNSGCLEATASGWALERLVRSQPEYIASGLAGEDEINFRILEKWYLKQDKTAVSVLKKCVKAWRTGILNLIHAYDPELVVLSGAIMNFRGLYQMLTEGLDRFIWDCCGHVEIKRAEHPEDSVLYGLYHLVKNFMTVYN